MSQGSVVDTRSEPSSPPLIATTICSNPAAAASVKYLVNDSVTSALLNRLLYEASHLVKNSDAPLDQAELRQNLNAITKVVSKLQSELGGGGGERGGDQAVDNQTRPESEKKKKTTTKQKGNHKSADPKPREFLLDSFEFNNDWNHGALIGKLRDINPGVAIEFAADFFGLTVQEEPGWEPVMHKYQEEEIRRLFDQHAHSYQVSVGGDVWKKEADKDEEEEVEEEKEKEHSGVGDVFHGVRFEEEACMAFEENGVCRFGERCRFAHRKVDAVPAAAVPLPSSSVDVNHVHASAAAATSVVVAEHVPGFVSASWPASIPSMDAVSTRGREEKEEANTKKHHPGVDRKACWAFADTQTCARGDQCPFTHGEDDARDFRLAGTRSAYACTQWIDSGGHSCTYGDTCRFAHSDIKVDC